MGPGDRVGVAALSGPVDPGRLEAGVAALRRLGFEPVLADNLRSRHTFFAGPDAERLAAFHRLAADPHLPAILFARGGHGVLRLLPHLDWDLLARYPRAYMGFSDLTPFLLAVVHRLGLVAFHGPMVAADLARGMSPEDEASFLDALAGRYPAEIPFERWLRAPSRTPAGPLLGGCLSLLTATLGTPWFPDLEGAVLFWEDLNEAPYRLDRQLTHLGLSSNLAEIEAMVVGHLGGTEGTPEASVPSAEWAAVVADGLAGFSWPVAWGLPAGHWAPNRTLPLGLRARLEEGRIVVGED